ncbi:25-hydroxycholesterol 7-alpha-hydroxylase [Tolypocladium paradoxum]|uniref:25-hydroxycholesterol 7-alpha-hydroxylase n=1 Tax=Tolypocladium paradoxum TaxID=94208 RepID=A0A2S4KVH1_9HYPO|nr:25-hydroxycholesterol 7-alpha-hydroxylase [Tolypocladium paradoxum]
MDGINGDESVQVNELNADGVISNFGGRSSRATIILATLLVGGILISPLVSWLLSSSHDPREPPLLKPRVPFVGHIINLIRFQNEFHTVLHKTNSSVPIATLPMLNGKMYTIFDPDLIQSALRSTTASFEPFVVEFAQRSFGLTDTTFAKITSQPRLVPEFTEAIHRSFQPTSLQRMNIHFLGSISTKLDPISDGTLKVDEANSGRERKIDAGLEVGNLFGWCRDVMSMATTKALYGNSDPFSKDPSLIPAMWYVQPFRPLQAFEKSLPFFLLSLFPSITMPKGFQARETLQRVMTEYYESEHDMNDPTTSALTANRASVLRTYGFTGEEIAKLEAILPVVATTNAVPTFFWMLIFVLSRPTLVARLRAEVESAATFNADEKSGGGKTATLDITRFDEQLPLMVSCYRETMRVVNHSVSMRRAVADISLTGQDGQTYLLKRGVDIHLSAGVTHGAADIWGSDAADFNAERFLLPPGKDNSGARGSEADRKRKAAFIPFGGGKHLCPGRNLAFCEILGFMSMMLLRFDIEPLGMEFGDLELEGSKLSAPSCKPVKGGEGLGARITTRPGWEKTKFTFKC